MGLEVNFGKSDLYTGKMTVFKQHHGLKHWVAKLVNSLISTWDRILEGA